MFSVYKITNKINNKCYIGSSIHYERRWKQHRTIAFNSNHKCYNYPLYAAFRKYGLDNFTFELLKTDFTNTDEMCDYEKEMIIFYDSLNNGYNQTLETHNALYDEEIKHKAIEKMSTKCAKVDINNNIIEIYTSYHDASRKNGYGESAYSSIRSVCKGLCGSLNGEYYRDLDENNQIIIKPFKRPHGKKTIIGIPLDYEKEDIYFSSISEASQKLNIERRSIQKCLQGLQRYTNVGGYIWREIDLYGNIIENSINIDDVIEKYEKGHPLINGERKTLNEWLSIYNISRNSYYYRLKQGMTNIEAITTPKKRS